MFLLKKIVAPFFMPLSVCLILAGLGLFLLWFTRRQRTGKVLVTASFLVLGLLSYDGVSDMLAGPLERQYQPIRDLEGIGDVRWVVVLSGGSRVDPDLPVSTWLSNASIVRLAEGVRLHRALPGTRLVLTGGCGFGKAASSAQAMGDVAVSWGVGAEEIVLEKRAKDTGDHSVYVKEIVEDEPFLLVTSASHMPRAMMLFRKEGMNPLPAPTDYMVKRGGGGLRPHIFFPAARALDKAERAIHEYLGMVWESGGRPESAG